MNRPNRSPSRAREPRLLLNETQMRRVIELIDLYGAQPLEAKAQLDGLAKAGVFCEQQRRAVRIMFLLPGADVDVFLRDACADEGAKRLWQCRRGTYRPRVA